MTKKRVVVTGLGIQSPLGTGLDKNWNGVLEGKSGIGPITKFDASEFPVKIAGEILDFEATDFIAKKSLKQMDVFIQYALASSFMALEHAGLGRPTDMGERAGIVIGSGIGGLPEIERTHMTLLEKGPGRISPFFIPKLIVNLAGGQVAIATGARGPINCPVTACATGNHAIGEACRYIERGDADIVIAGGSEAVITPLAIGGFAAMRALSKRNDDPTKASRPFDKDRDGFVMGEACGILILESLEHAEKRGANILAEMKGYGLSSDGYHITSPAPGGAGAVRCINMAIDDAGIDPSEVSYVNAHGTSTNLNDKLETAALKTVFGDHANKLAISSTKSMTGHTLGAAGGIESVFSVLSIMNDIAPPTINYQTPDEECDLDYIPNKPRKMTINNVLSNSFGFGGANASLVFGKPD